MKNITLENIYISYPFSSNITYRNQYPFIRIITQNHVYYGFELKQLSLIDLNQKDTIQIFNNYEIPNENHHNILKQATSQVRGITYQCLYVSNHHYLCLGLNDTYVSMVVINIELNSKGYYEIQGIKDILKEQ